MRLKAILCDLRRFKATLGPRVGLLYNSGLTWIESNGTDLRNTYEGKMRNGYGDKMWDGYGDKNYIDKSKILFEDRYGKQMKFNYLVLT